MTTYDYELLSQPVTEIASNILNYDRAGDYPAADLLAVLRYAQHEQNQHLYERVLAELDRRAAADEGAWAPGVRGRLVGAACKPTCADLTAGTTEVRVHFLSCGCVRWTAYPPSDSKTINYCLRCDHEAIVMAEHDVQAVEVQSS